MSQPSQAATRLALSAAVPVGALDRLCGPCEMPRMARDLDVVRLGRQRYDEAMSHMERLVLGRVEGTARDTVLLLEHEPVVTLGRRKGGEANILVPEALLTAKGIELRTTERGGDVTYHGPGQLVAYPVLDLRPDRCDVRQYVTDLEQVMIDVAAHYGVRAERVSGQNGAWVEGKRKIGAVGVRIARWVTSHGVALNVNTDLSAFDLIVPCGIRDKGVTSLAKELGRPVDFEEASAVFEAKLRAIFH